MAIVSRDDWSLHRKGQQAQARHKAKVKAAIKRNLKDIITNEGLIVQDGNRVVRIPVHSLDEPHFQYSRSKQKHIGQGEAEQGQVIGQAGNGEGTGSGDKAGDGPGETIYEAEVTLEDIEDILFVHLQLPNLKPKAKQQIQVHTEEWTDIRKRGIQSNLDRKRTFMEALKRSQRQQTACQITRDDLRFRTYDDTEQPQTGAVVIAMMDISASMGEFEKYVARTFFFWVERFLDKHYPHVEMRYLVHHTEAAEVSSTDFYQLRESGGTRCSSVYQLALQMVDEEYPEDVWNVYPFHVSDGDNLTSDNRTAVQLMEMLCRKSSLVGYLEVAESHGYRTTLAKELLHIEEATLRTAKVAAQEGVLAALSHFFHQDKVSAKGVESQ